MSWHEYKPSDDFNTWQQAKHKKDRSFLHGILIGGFLTMIVFGITFGTLYGNLLAKCGA